MAPRREDELADRLDELREWALAETHKLWSRIDPTRVQPGWVAIRPALLEVHRALVIEALDATDLYMLTKAADVGVRYTVRWTDDYRDRPEVTGTGQPTAVVFDRAPIHAMWKMRQGLPPSRAMRQGLNVIGRVMGSEAHLIGREVTLTRIRRDLAERGV